MLLELEWEPHVRIDRLDLTANGQIPAPGLRAEFRRLRRLGLASVLSCPCRPDSLPEMAAFSLSPDTGPFAHYEMGEEGNRTPSPPPICHSYDRFPTNTYCRIAARMD